MLPDRSPANAAFVAWFTSPLCFQIILGKRERYRDNFSDRLGFRCSERKALDERGKAVAEFPARGGSFA
jgi:hypothetical protein